MGRKRVTELLPILLPLRIKQKRLCYYFMMHFDGNKYARELCKKPMTELVFESRSLMVNRESGYDLKYQYNKVHNLKLAAKSISGIVINPGESFSLCRQMRNADKDEPYKEGLCLVDGEIKGEYGGGLCQMSELLYWLFLHSDLTITERHSHGVLSIAPASQEGPAGVDVTINEGWLDLKVRNVTERKYQIIIDFDSDYIIGRLMSNEKECNDYEIYNSRLEYIRDDQGVYEYTSVNRRKKSRLTGLEKDQLLYEQKCLLTYTVPEEKITGKEVI